jgi:hypothetical protein
LRLVRSDDEEGPSRSGSWPSSRSGAAILPHAAIPTLVPAEGNKTIKIRGGERNIRSRRSSIYHFTNIPGLEFFD